MSGLEYSAAEAAEINSYDPGDPVPRGVRFMTLEEVRALDCNQCGGCCGSMEADVPGGLLRLFPFGEIPKHQWRHFNGGDPLIIPLTRKGNDRAWRPTDAVDGEAEGEGPPLPPYRCSQLQRRDDGSTACGLWQSKRPKQCGTYPVDHSDLDRFAAYAYVLLNTAYQRRCTWVDTIVCPPGSPLLEWRTPAHEMPELMTQAQWHYVREMFAQAWREMYGDEDDELLTRKGWLSLIARLRSTLDR